MKMDIKKVENELWRIGKNQSWLAREIGVTRQAVHWWFVNPKRVPLMKITKIAAVLNYDPKDLIK